jgi:hypothetical protein
MASRRSGKRPCRICRKWFLPDPRVGARQRACSSAECQSQRRSETQASWRKRNPEYFIARRIVERDTAAAPSPLRVPAPLSKLPWDLAQDQFGVQGTDFIGVMGRMLRGYAQDQYRAYIVDSVEDPGRLPPVERQDQFGRMTT